MTSLHYPVTWRKQRLEVEHGYFAGGKFAKFEIHLLLYMYFKNLTMKAYVMELKKFKFANVQFRKFDHFEPCR